MNNKKILSLITVSYNAEQTIERTINSVIAQKDECVEYIIIDGMSTDRTVDIISKYKDDIDFFLTEEDDGIYWAMNKGIAHSNGEYIGFVNADDWLEPNAVKLVLNNLRLHNADIYYGDINFVDANSSIMYKPEALELFGRKMPIFHPATVVRKELFSRWGIFDTHYNLAADYEFLLRVYCKGACFKYMDVLVSNFSVGGQSFKQRLLSQKETYDIVKKFSKYSQDEMSDVLFANNSFLMAIYDVDYPRFEKILFEMISGFEKIVVVGAGLWGKRVVECLIEKNANLVCVIDKNKVTLGDIPVFGYDHISNLDKDVLFLVSSVINSVDMKKEVKKINSEATIIDINQIDELYCGIIE